MSDPDRPHRFRPRKLTGNALPASSGLRTAQVWDARKGKRVWRPVDRLPEAELPCDECGGSKGSLVHQ